jgi:hypothetical protein
LSGRAKSWIFVSREAHHDQETEGSIQGSRIKEQLEALVGHKIDASEEQLAKFSYPIGQVIPWWYTLTTWRTVYPHPHNFCTRQWSIDISGVSSTLDDGKRVFRLREFLCDPLTRRIGFVEPVNVVATPRAERPVFLTMTYVPVPPEPQVTYIPDVQITVFAWRANGAAAPNIEFDWRCRATAFFPYEEPPVGPG